ncbi:hypothetical protein RJ641_026770 [Dillenia turbinata]|uniref:Methyltransferase type 11 domain-containing protein n=1 Tax=Dillenia turbinata TaxID=194707 RepID=A0AAN8VUV1_9MAGN
MVFTNNVPSFDDNWEQLRESMKWVDLLLDFESFLKLQTPDSLFYEQPRSMTHIDDPSIAALTKYYSKVFPPSNTPGVSMLDMCSSWVSHFPAGYKRDRIAGMGTNKEELKRNPVLTEYVVQDLNVSIDHLTKPIDVFKEMCQILEPGGLAILWIMERFETESIARFCWVKYSVSRVL